MNDDVSRQRLREELILEAKWIIQGRADFERHFGRKSLKPLRQITLDPHEVLQLLDEDYDDE